MQIILVEDEPGAARILANELRRQNTPRTALP